MQFSTTFIVEDSEPMVHHNLVLMLREAGYKPRPDGYYQRGTREGSLISFDPSKWLTRLAADTSSTPEFYTQVDLSYDVQTAGQVLKYQNRRFWLDEVGQFVSGLGGRQDSYQAKLEQALGLDKRTLAEAPARLNESQKGLKSKGGKETVPSSLIQEHQRQMKNGANWFFWIAGLSLVDSILYFLKSDLGFSLGLGISQVIDAFSRLMIEEIPEGLALLRGTALLVNLFILVIFVVFGALARKGKGWAFIVGISLYLFDGVISIMVGAWFAVLFHAIALYGLMRGYLALRELHQIEESQVISWN